MPAHDGIQAIVDQCPVDHPVGLVPLVHVKVVHIVGEMGVAEVLSVSGEMFCGAGESRITVRAF